MDKNTAFALTTLSNLVRTKITKLPDTAIVRDKYFPEGREVYKAIWSYIDNRELGIAYIDKEWNVPIGIMHCWYDGKKMKTIYYEMMDSIKKWEELKTKNWTTLKILNG